MTGVDRVAEPWGTRTPYHGERWPTRVDTFLADGVAADDVDSWVQSATAPLQRAEDQLAAKLLHVSDRHKADHDICYLAEELAGWSQDHVRGSPRRP